MNYLRELRIPKKQNITDLCTFPAILSAKKWMEQYLMFKH